MAVGMRFIGSVFAAGILAACAGAQAQSPATTTAPPAPPTASTPATAAPATADASPGKALVEEQCVTCHAMTVVTATGRTPQEWSDIVDKMAGYGLEATADQQADIKAYLAKALPKS